MRKRGNTGLGDRNTHFAGKEEEGSFLQASRARSLREGDELDKDEPETGLDRVLSQVSAEKLPESASLRAGNDPGVPARTG